MLPITIQARELQAVEPVGAPKPVACPMQTRIERRGEDGK
jgi:hypothetical protein